VLRSDTVRRRLFARCLAGPMVVALLAWGCATKPTGPVPLPLGAVGTSVVHYAGTVLSGPGSGAVSAVDPASAGEISVTWLAMEKLPPGFALAGPQAAIVTAARGDNAVLSSVSLSRDMRFGPVKNADAFIKSVRSGTFGRFTDIGTGEGIQWPGVTAQFDLRESAQQIDPLSGQGALRGLGLRIESSAPAGKKPIVAVGLSVTDFASAGGVANGALGVAGGGVVTGAGSFQTETLIVGESGATPMAYVMLEPFRFGTTSAIVAAVVRMSAPPPASGAGWADHQKLCASVSGQLAGGAAIVTPAEIAGWPGMAAAQAALAVPSGQRSALVFTAGEVNVPIAVDVALVADDSVVATICGSIVHDLSASKTPPDSSALAWLIEKQTYLSLLNILNNEKVPPELSGLLSAYAGEAGRQSASLSEVLRDATGPADLASRLVRENMDYLEDSAPSARVRAYDWLNSQGTAPAGFDPLGTPQQRRAALEAMRRGSTTREAATGSVSP